MRSADTKILRLTTSQIMPCRISCCTARMKSSERLLARWSICAPCILRWTSMRLPWLMCWGLIDCWRRCFWQWSRIKKGAVSWKAKNSRRSCRSSQRATTTQVLNMSIWRSMNRRLNFICWHFRSQISTWERSIHYVACSSPVFCRWSRNKKTKRSQTGRSFFIKLWSKGKWTPNSNRKLRSLKTSSRP